MRIKRIFVILVAMTICLCPRPVMAAEGTIRITMPENMKEAVVCYSKDGEEEKSVRVNGEETVVLPNLEAGTYQIRVQDTQEYAFTPTQINVPLWSEEEQKMLYDISIVPKYSRNVSSPQTGDNSQSVVYAGIGLISLIIVAIMSCHNHFKCGKMSRKYSN